MLTQFTNEHRMNMEESMLVIIENISKKNCTEKRKQYQQPITLIFISVLPQYFKQMQQKYTQTHSFRPVNHFNPIK